MPKKKNTDPDATGNTPAADPKSPGAAAGKTAPVEATPARPPAISRKIPKLAKKNKSRLPRRQKKAQQKAAQRQ